MDLAFNSSAGNREMEAAYEYKRKKKAAKGSRKV